MADIRIDETGPFGASNHKSASLQQSNPNFQRLKIGAFPSGPLTLHGRNCALPAGALFPGIRDTPPRPRTVQTASDAAEKDVCSALREHFHRYKVHFDIAGIDWKRRFYVVLDFIEIMVDEIGIVAARRGAMVRACT